MLPDTKDSDAHHAKKFNWWWRGLFVSMEGPSAIGLNIPPKSIIRRPIKWSKTPDAGIVFRSSYLEHERSAFLYELEKRLVGKYRFRKPWIELDEEHRTRLLKIWPGRSRAEFVRYSTEPLRLRGGWTTPMVSSWNLRLNDGTLVSSFKRFISSQRKSLNIPNPTANKGVQRKPRSWHPIEWIDLKNNRERLLTDGETSQVSKAEREYKDSI